MRTMVTRQAVSFLLPVLGVFLIGAIPYLLFSNVPGISAISILLQTGKIKNALFLDQDIGFHFGQYFDNILRLFQTLITGGELMYYEYRQFKPMFPAMFEPYYYSAKLLAGALIFSITAALLCAVLIKLLPAFLQKTIRTLLTVLESLPDVFVIVIVQFGVILLYRETQSLIIQIYYNPHSPPYVFPIICLSILPILFLIKTLLFLLDGEEETQYVEFALGKGLGKWRIISSHMLRNSLISLFFQSKTIFWILLSNLFIVEYILYMPGITAFMRQYGLASPDVVTIGLLMLFIPFYVIFSAISFVLYAKLGIKEADA
ncbi:ABC transporter permease subunit [Fictibacillus iocasae]|uniref:ABC transporter permease subunit n=1 Tax=Fictibacillus iocasae TaxID=2715437 RepID=A0ABW2NLJ4_9BACL